MTNEPQRTSAGRLLLLLIGFSFTDFASIRSYINCFLVFLVLHLNLKKISNILATNLFAQQETIECSRPKLSHVIACVTVAYQLLMNIVAREWKESKSDIR